MGKLTPSDLERLPTELVKLMSDLEMRILLDIVRRIQEAGEITRSADYQIWKLNKLGFSKRMIRNYITKLLDASEIEVDNMFDEVIEKGYTYEKKLYKAYGKDFIPYENNEELKQYVEGLKAMTNDTLKNITNTMGIAKLEDGKTIKVPLETYYSDTLDKAFNDIATGAFDYNTVLKRTVSELEKSGVRSIDYKSDRSDRIDVATRRALSTSLNQLASKIVDINAEKLETDYYEVSAHSTARPSHQKWQGKVYSSEELKTVCGLGKPDGLLGINCYHNYWAFIPRSIY